MEKEVIHEGGEGSREEEERGMEGKGEGGWEGKEVERKRREEWKGREKGDGRGRK